MKIRIEICMDNDAFQADNRGGEVARILRKLANSVEGEHCNEGDITHLIDLNGNKVGEAEVVA